MRYLKLWLQFLKISWMADFEYRFNFVVRIFGEFMWYTAQISVFEVLYTHTQSLYGWDINAVRVFMGTLFLVDGIYMVFFSENLDHLSSLVRKGDLDLYLVKPINSQFMISLRKVASANLVNCALVSLYLLWALSRLSQTVSFGQATMFAIMAACGVVLFYCTRLLFGMLVFVLHEAGNVQFVWYNLYRLGTRPDILYPRYLRLIIMTAIPVGLIASVPARILVEGPDFKLLLWSVSVAILFFIVTALCWQRALRNYASASS